MTLLTYIAQEEFRFLHDDIEVNVTDHLVNICFWDVTAIKFQQVVLSRLRTHLEDRSGVKWKASVTMKHYAGPIPRTGGDGIRMIKAVANIDQVVHQPSGEIQVEFPGTTDDSVVNRCMALILRYDNLFKIICNGVMGLDVSFLTLINHFSS